MPAPHDPPCFSIPHTEQLRHRRHRLLVFVHLRHAIGNHHPPLLDKRRNPLRRLRRQHLHIKQHQHLIPVQPLIHYLLLMQYIQLPKRPQKQLERQPHIKILLLHLDIMRSRKQHARLRLHLRRPQQPPAGLLDQPQPLPKRFPVPGIHRNIVPRQQIIRPRRHRRGGHLPLRPVKAGQFRT
ncbi:MAG: hypothetical protein BWY71_01890 [Planctomycetes bacterium ADurb.Bin412]|nr:MAG: hypothetical protein BWY71_01890 [Planctomycetes bacterium ADurb.Bin412]